MSSNFAAFKQHEYTQDEVRVALKQAGLVSSTAAIVHASLFSLGHMVDDNNDLAQTWIDLLLEAVGPDGAIILPAFTYSYCKGKVYNPHKSLSTVSLLANQAIVTHQGYRTLDPIFSYVILPGSEAVAEKVAAYQFSNVCFDMDNSVIGLVESLCERPVLMEIKSNQEGASFTVMHHVDQEIKRPTRFMKKFTGNTKLGNQVHQSDCYYFCRVFITNTELDMTKVMPLSSNNVSLGNGGIELHYLYDYFDDYRKATIADPWRLMKGPVLSDSELEVALANEQVIDEGSIVRELASPVKL